ncbi:glyoxalase [Tetragenococcus halophilus subsp. flandriensis]|uniref:VOC family protein n=1 Tax=Tetragenococcus halophilus TaxID=51669 RepID=UPI0023E900F4|nr:VOC family protein [Tetragenococcus halophilus]GMA08116.1 glyoxalase [Tetragenococcus halophilus subsp. flandriensis]
MRIYSLYICVEDMKRAIQFYEDFFNKKVDVKDKIYSVFCIGTFRFGLFDYKKESEIHTIGNNCLPSIEVEKLDIGRVKNVLKKYKRQITFPETIIGDNIVFEFKDTESNTIEVTVPR